jgi:hypothetical protein
LKKGSIQKHIQLGLDLCELFAFEPLTVSSSSREFGTNPPKI